MCQIYTIYRLTQSVALKFFRFDIEIILNTQLKQYKMLIYNTIYFFEDIGKRLFIKKYVYF